MKHKIARNRWSKAWHALGVALVVVASSSAFAAKGYEVWVSDQTNSAGISAMNDTGTHGGFMRIYDGDCLESKNIECPAGGSTLIGTPTRLHGMLPSRNHNDMNVNFVVSGHLAIVDARTRDLVALLRSTGTDTGRQNHMSCSSPDGRYLLVSNQNGEPPEPVNISWDESGENIVAAVWDKAATLDLGGNLSSRLVAGQEAAADTANYPLGSVSGGYAV